MKETLEKKEIVLKDENISISNVYSNKDDYNARYAKIHNECYLKFKEKKYIIWNDAQLVDILSEFINSYSNIMDMSIYQCSPYEAKRFNTIDEYHYNLKLIYYENRKILKTIEGLYNSFAQEALDMIERYREEFEAYYVWFTDNGGSEKDINYLLPKYNEPNTNNPHNAEYLRSRYYRKMCGRFNKDHPCYIYFKFLSLTDLNYLREYINNELEDPVLKEIELRNTGLITWTGNEIASAGHLFYYLSEAGLISKDVVDVFSSILKYENTTAEKQKKSINEAITGIKNSKRNHKNGKEPDNTRENTKDKKFIKFARILVDDYFPERPKTK